MYANSKKNFFSKLRSEETSPLIEPPTRDEIKGFWGGIYEDKKEHNSEAEWIKKEKERMADVKEPQWEEITEDTIRSNCKRLANWKAPGIDQVQNFWIKHLKSLHTPLAQHLDSLVKNPSLTPKWMTKGKTSLAHKAGPTNVAKNYRPITCLPTYYKLLTRIFTDQI